MRRLLQVSMLDPCLVFLTFDVDQIEKVSQHHPIELPNLRVICLKIQLCKVTKFYRSEYVTGEMGFQVNNDLIYIC